MNAADFISKTEYDELLRDVFSGKRIAYKKTVRVKKNGNRYTLRFFETDVSYFDKFGWFSGLFEKCYLTAPASMSISGNTIFWYERGWQYKDFEKMLNSYIQSTPDYSEEVQLTLF